MKSQEKLHLYLIPGMATDCRVFEGFDLKNYHVHCIKWTDYTSSESLSAYAEKLLEQIDQSEPFALAGVSMGGMIAQEMAIRTKPEFVALISSAESVNELPKFYRAGEWLPFHHLNNSLFLDLYLKTPFAMRGVHAHANRDLYINMIRDTGVDFMNWQIDKIVSWTGRPEGITCPLIRLHGQDDRVIPHKDDIRYDRVVDGRTHKMVINKPSIVCEWLDELALRAELSPFF